MADLRQLLTGAGHRDVRTHLQSGNVIFTTRRTNREQLIQEIERGIKERLGLSVRCLVRSSDELQATIDGNPLQEVATDGSRMLALFLSEPFDSNFGRRSQSD
jgi:uncharacterized protein (DUF1697 family)